MGVCKFRALLFVLLSGCQSIPQPVDEEKTFKQDLILDISGIKAEGVAVVPEALTYMIKVESKGDIDLFVLKTCNREIEIKGHRKQGIFGRNKRIEYEFIPNARERDTGCPLEVFALAENGRHSFALIAFHNKRYSLPITIECNGETVSAVGTSICQSRAGLTQRIKFPGPVLMASLLEECDLPEFTIPGDLVFPLKPTLCNYSFTEEAEPHRRHRLYTVGYEEFIVKGAGE